MFWIADGGVHAVAQNHRKNCHDRRAHESQCEIQRDIWVEGTAGRPRHIGDSGHVVLKSRVNLVLANTLYQFFIEQPVGVGLLLGSLIFEIARIEMIVFLFRIDKIPLQQSFLILRPVEFHRTLPDVNRHRCIELAFQFFHRGLLPVVFGMIYAEPGAYIGKPSAGIVQSSDGFPKIVILGRPQRRFERACRKRVE